MHIQTRTAGFSLIGLTLLVFGSLVLTPRSARAVATQNHVLHILPAPGPVKMNCSTADWDFSGGLFTCGDVVRLRNKCSVWLLAMYDKKNLYLLAKWKDPTPLNNPQSSYGGFGFNGDCLQVRFITNYDTPQEKVSHWTCWRDVNKISVVNVVYGRTFKGGTIPNAIADGAQQAFKIDADGKGYLQEIAIPWKLLTANGKPLVAGDTMRMALEPNFTAGPPWGRLDMHDIFRTGIANPDRVFTFRAYSQWGKGVLEPKGHMRPAPVILSDGRRFPVRMVHGWPVATWTGLVRKHPLPGFIPVRFNTPANGYVSLNIYNKSGTVVRQLLTANFEKKGPHRVMWDGLTTPDYTTPGSVLPTGRYTWRAIFHPTFQLTLRGWAASAGSAPWLNGPTTAWGGDHGAPDAVATDGKRMFLGWSYAEAGPALIATDLAGHVLWRVGWGAEVSCQDLAVDHGILYSLGVRGYKSRGQVVCLRARDGVYTNWHQKSSAVLAISSLWEGKAERQMWPASASGLAVRAGRMYLTFSSQQLQRSQIIHWRRLATMLLRHDPLDMAIYRHIDQRTTQHLAAFIAGKITRQQAFGTYNPRFDFSLMHVLNAIINTPARMPVKTAPSPAAVRLRSLLERLGLVHGEARMSPMARAEANRRFLTEHFAGCIAPLKTNFIAVCSARSGRLLRTWPVRFPQAVQAMGHGLVGFISGGRRIMVLNTQTGVVRPLVHGLDDATNFTMGAHGKIYVAEAGALQQVQTFSVGGKLIGAIGRRGGRRLLGPWQADGMYQPAALAVDNRHGHLWVAEADFYPKRVSVWNLKTGRLVKEFFGPGHYGASGGAIDPWHPNRMVGEGCAWRINPKTGHARCTGIVNRRYNGFAVFCHPGNDHTYLAVNFEVMHDFAGLRIYERIGPGDYRPCAEWRPDYANQTTLVWSDRNGDGKIQPDEITTLPFAIQFHGSNEWSTNINPTDFTLFGLVSGPNTARALCSAAREVPGTQIHLTQKIFRRIYRINPAGFTACGAPRWHLKKIQSLPYVWSHDLEAGGGGMLPSAGNHMLVTCGVNAFRCYNLATKQLLWSYPDPFYQVGASHFAPEPEPGLLRGPYGLVGTFKTPQTGTVWCINGNCGEWYLLTAQGFYLAHLFQGSPFKLAYPKAAVPGADMTEAPSGSGAEDFGGSLTQAPDEKVYIEAGKTADWNIRVHGLRRVVSIGSGVLTVSRSDLALARRQREIQLQVAAGRKQMIVRHMQVTFTGHPQRDFHGGNWADFHKGRSTVRVFTAWDRKNLYLGWHVVDATPWVNHATAPAQMYMSGDTVDFQFGSNFKADPKRAQAGAGDFRISIGSFHGKPTALMYRWVSKIQKPMIFSSGVVHSYRVAYVAVMHHVRIKETTWPNRQGYNVEVALPWSSLAFTPKSGVRYSGDMGVTYSNAAGDYTDLRNYWSNQRTGLVSDAVFELRLDPADWGQFIFQK